MTTFKSTSSLGKFDTSDLSDVDTSSQTNKPGLLLWESSDHEEKAWRGRTRERFLAAINDTGGHLGSVFLIGHSWCVGPAIFLVWRITIFIYLVVTLVVLSFRGTFIPSEVSVGIYVAQVLASFFTILSSTLVYLDVRKEESREMHEQVTWPQERMSEFEKSKQQVTTAGRGSTNHFKIRVTRAINLLALLLTQNCCVTVIFWNIVFWFEVQGREHEFSSSHTNDLLLHLYNLIPVLYEIVIGCAVFRTVNYLPSAITVISVLVGIYTTSLKDLSTTQQVPGSEWGLSGKWDLLGRILQMFLIYIMCCSFLSITQRGRQMLIRWL